jgi:hypothetical protein
MVVPRLKVRIILHFQRRIFALLGAGEQNYARPDIKIQGEKP